jgi:hypothetical protein
MSSVPCITVVDRPRGFFASVCANRGPTSALVGRLRERAERAHKPPLTEKEHIGHISLRSPEFRWTTE